MGKLETLDKAVGFGLALRVDQAMRITVAHKEALQPQGIGTVPRPNQHHAAEASADQTHAPQDEGTHDDLADVRFRGHHAAKIIRVHAQYVAVHGHTRGRHHGAAVEHVHLAAELPRRVHREDIGLTVLVDIEDLDDAVQHKEEVDAALAALEQHRASRYVFLLPVGGDAPDHGGVKARNICSLRFIGSVGS